MYDWKKEFKLHILARGLDYSRSGKVGRIISGSVPSQGMEISACVAQVSGSEETSYEVQLEMSSLRIHGMSCTCPYAKKGEHCKHMAAVLFRLEADGGLPFADAMETVEGLRDMPKEEILLGLLRNRLIEDGLLNAEQFTNALQQWKNEFQVTVSDDGAKPVREADLEASLQRDRRQNEVFAGQEKDDKFAESRQAQKADEKTLEELLAELDSLVGLEQVKQDIHTLINFVKINQVRAARGLKKAEVSYHLVFSGNPGTGKTTVARLLAKLYQKIGVLPKGHLVEVDRSQLIAGYLGQTAIKTAEVIEKALGGILFIDEAYSLAADDQDSYGKECIATILKAMEDHRDELVVVVAGYDNLMHRFIDSNPGLRSRFNKYFHFPDYTGEEMEQIFLLQCKNNGYQVGTEAQGLLRTYFERMYAERDENFGNGRDVRNLFENIINAQANRLAMNPDLTTEELLELTVEDVQAVIGVESCRKLLENNG